MMEDWQDIASGERSVIWQSADPAGASSLNENAAAPASYITLKSSGGLLYAGWYENIYYHMKVYNNDDTFPQWTPLPSCNLSGGTNGTMEIHDGQAHLFTFATGSLYCYRLNSGLGAWEEIGAGTIDYGGTPELPLKLVSYAGRLYAIWKETHIRMKRYDGGTTWTPVEDIYGYGINDVSDTAYGLQAAVHNGLLFVAFGAVTAPSPHRAIKVRVFNGSTWSTAGQGIDIVKNTGNYSNQCSMAPYNGSLYLLWREFETPTPYDGLWVTRLNGLSWDRMDGRTTLTRDGLRYAPRDDTSVNNTAATAALEALTVVNGRLAAAWREDCGPLPAPTANPIQLRCALFNGDERAPGWIFIDGGLATGLNVDTGQSIGEVYPASHDAKLYIGFTEYNGAANNFHVKVGY